MHSTSTTAARSWSGPTTKLRPDPVRAARLAHPRLGAVVAPARELPVHIEAVQTARTTSSPAASSRCTTTTASPGSSTGYADTLDGGVRRTPRASTRSRTRRGRGHGRRCDRGDAVAARRATGRGHGRRRRPPPATDDHPFPYLRTAIDPGFYLVALALILLCIARAASGSPAGRSGRCASTPTCSSWARRSCCSRRRTSCSSRCCSARRGSSTRSCSPACCSPCWPRSGRRDASRSAGRSAVRRACSRRLVVAWFVPPAWLLTRCRARGSSSPRPRVRADLHSRTSSSPSASRNGDSTTAFGANLLGAMFGGVLEYAALVVGYRSLLIGVALLYGLARSCSGASTSWRQYRWPQHRSARDLGSSHGSGRIGGPSPHAASGEIGEWAALPGIIVVAGPWQRRRRGGYERGEMAVHGQVRTDRGPRRRQPRACQPKSSGLDLWRWGLGPRGTSHRHPTGGRTPVVRHLRPSASLRSLAPLPKPDKWLAASRSIRPRPRPRPRVRRPPGRLIAQAPLRGTGLQGRVSRIVYHSRTTRATSTSP